MKALSLIQPYATLIALGYKLNETRSFKTSYRGPLLIHASLSKPKWAREVCEPPKGKYKPWEEKPQPNKLIVEVLERHADIKKALYDAYPFGQRAYHPYKVWLDEIRRQRKRPRRGKPSATPSPQTELLSLSGNGRKTLGFSRSL